MRVVADGAVLALICGGCGERRVVPSGCALRAFNTHVNRFRRQHADICEIRGRHARDYQKAGRAAEKIIGRFTRAKP